MKICIVRRIRLCSLCVGAFIVLVLVGCSIETANHDPNSVESSQMSMALYVTESRPLPTSSPTAEPTMQSLQLEQDSDDPAILARFSVVYNALLYTRPHPASEDERIGYYIPVGRTANVLGVSADGEWLLIRHSAGVDGWVETARVDASAVALQQLLTASPSIADLVPTPTLFSSPPTAAPIASNDLNEPPVFVQSSTVVPPVPTATSEPEPNIVQQLPSTDDVPLPAVTTFADGTSDIVELTALEDAAIFINPNPSTAPEERTGYFVPAGESVYAVGLADDRYWMHVVYANAVQGWVSPGYFIITSGDMGMLPSSDYRVVRDETVETERTSVWRLPSRPGHTE